MNTRQELLVVIEQLPDRQLRSLLEIARTLYETELLSPEDKSINLQELGTDKNQAAELRSRLSSFAEEWNSPEMGIYDDYDHYKK